MVNSRIRGSLTSLSTSAQAIRVTGVLNVRWVQCQRSIPLIVVVVLAILVLVVVLAILGVLPILSVLSILATTLTILTDLGVRNTGCKQHGQDGSEPHDDG